MTCKRIPAVLASLAALASVALAPSARADGYIISSGGLARSCYMAARLGRATAESVDQCTASTLPAATRVACTTCKPAAALATYASA